MLVRHLGQECRDDNDHPVHLRDHATAARSPPLRPRLAGHRTVGRGRSAAAARRPNRGRVIDRGQGPAQPAQPRVAATAPLFSPELRRAAARPRSPAGSPRRSSQAKGRARSGPSRSTGGVVTLRDDSRGATTRAAPSERIDASGNVYDRSPDLYAFEENREPRRGRHLRVPQPPRRCEQILPFLRPALPRRRRDPPLRDASAGGTTYVADAGANAIFAIGARGWRQHGGPVLPAQSRDHRPTAPRPTASRMRGGQDLRVRGGPDRRRDGPRRLALRHQRCRAARRTPASAPAARSTGQPGTGGVTGRRRPAQSHRPGCCASDGDIYVAELFARPDHAATRRAEHELLSTPLPATSRPSHGDIYATSKVLPRARAQRSRRQAGPRSGDPDRHADPRHAGGPRLLPGGVPRGLTRSRLASRHDAPLPRVRS